MIQKLKSVTLLLVALALAAAGGWIWGSAGTHQAEEALRQSGVRLHLTSARAQLLQARVQLSESNFGSARQSLAAASGDLQVLAAAFDKDGAKAAADAVRRADAKIGEAADAAGRLDQSAQAHAAEALKLLPTIP
ncbi:MAG: hypothetical protein NTY02_17930 [Acidobacteria bacterium]|nr:hypothetical protein [Acidobacteriota bacterium]